MEFLIEEALRSKSCPFCVEESYSVGGEELRHLLTLTTTNPSLISLLCRTLPSRDEAVPLPVPLGCLNFHGCIAQPRAGHIQGKYCQSVVFQCDGCSRCLSRLNFHSTRIFILGSHFSFRVVVIIALSTYLRIHQCYVCVPDPISRLLQQQPISIPLS